MNKFSELLKRIRVFVDASYNEQYWIERLWRQEVFWRGREAFSSERKFLAPLLNRGIKFRKPNFHRKEILRKHNRDYPALMAQRRLTNAFIDN
jgi:hypothetical protein